MGEGDLKELRELVEFLKASGVAEFDMERPELKVRLTFAQAVAAQAPLAGLDMAQVARLMAAAGGAGAGWSQATRQVTRPGYLTSGTDIDYN